MKIKKTVIAELNLIARKEVRELAGEWAETLGLDATDPRLVAVLAEAFMMGLPDVSHAELALTRVGRAALAEIPYVTVIDSGPPVKIRGGQKSNLYSEGETLAQAAANLRLLYHGHLLGRILTYGPEGEIMAADSGEIVVPVPDADAPDPEALEGIEELVNGG